MKRRLRLVLATFVCLVSVVALVVFYVWPMYARSVSREPVELTILGAHMNVRGKVTRFGGVGVCEWNEGSGTATLKISGHGSYEVKRVLGDVDGATVLTDLHLPLTIDLPDTKEIQLTLDGKISGCPSSLAGSPALAVSLRLRITLWGDKTIYGITVADVVASDASALEFTGEEI